MQAQIALFNVSTNKAPDLLALDEYDRTLVSYSGGKDSLSLILYLLELGVPPQRMEVWHQAVDGRGPHHRPFFDWPSTEGYVRGMARHLGLRLFWQWRDQGIYGELYRENRLSRDVYYQEEGDPVIHHLPTSRGMPSTRRKFPAKTADLRLRWCSSAVKIDPARRVLNNREDFAGNPCKPFKVLWLTGERRQESPARSRYREVERHPGNTRRRLVHHWRPIIDWKEDDVWRIIEKNRLVVHPAYHLGFPRLSCRSCIFFSRDHWATLNEASPEAIRMIREVEEDLKFTVDGKYTVDELVRMGKSTITEENRRYVRDAVEPWLVERSMQIPEWALPLGAFGDGGGSI